MADKTRLRIVTPSREFYNDEADLVIMRTSVGDIGVLHGHQPLTTTLDYGVLEIRNDGEIKKAAVFGGFVNVLPDSITVLTDAAEFSDEIDLERATAARQRAEERINSKNVDIDVARAELALRRALIRINITTSNKIKNQLDK
jgi:F-type H+-transporting ATPase subunit epsilon